MVKKNEPKINPKAGSDEEIVDLTNKWKRALADYQNLEKRVQGEKEEFVKFSNAKLILKILEALDNLEKAETHLNDQGLRIAVKQLKEGLAEEGLTRIETIGKDFDPNLMECIGVGEGKENQVIEELRAGYLLNERLLRAAQVKVGKVN